jgi:SAM-dependent methyltransferase
VDYTQTNKETYDALAEEYESRVEALRSVYEEVADHFSVHLSNGGRMLEVGCGVGLAVEVLEKRGFSLAGIDISPRMAEFAKKRNPRAEIIVGDFITHKFGRSFDGMIALAFIHLFPKADSMKMLAKMFDILVPGGVLYIGTTEDKESREGWEVKEDYSGKYKRFRKHWTEGELRQALGETGFKFLELIRIRDPFDKDWMDFIVQKPNKQDFDQGLSASRSAPLQRG